MEFKNSYSLEERIKESTRIVNKFNKRIPVICYKIKNNQVKQLEKNKYLVPKDINISQFLIILRKRIQLEQNEALYIFINKKIPPQTLSFLELYKNYKDEDGFLYVEYGLENTFGNI